MRAVPSSAIILAPFISISNGCICIVEGMNTSKIRLPGGSMHQLSLERRTGYGFEQDL